VGMRPDVIAALVRRVQASDPAVVRAPLKRLQGQDLIEALQDRLSLVLEYVDPVAMSQASLKDLAIATGVLVDKVQLLKNMPTQIIDFTTRQQLHQLAPRLMAEMKRRGVTFDGEARRVDDAA
jgi:alpha-D-ribose 1-methylphosphonate 5-triphosphate synthase subunit PhnL